MAYEIIPNVILFTTIVAALVILFRHVPEVVDTTGNNRTDRTKNIPADSALPVDSSHGFVKFYKNFISVSIVVSTSVWKVIQSTSIFIAKKVFGSSDIKTIHNVTPRKYKK